MSDLRFLIVNNHLQHSVAEKGKLDARVTFPVYQDTEDRRIWELMRGGKDDVFIYDRCGRLAYFIPFPLSIMNTDDALVPAAILATYFQSPCGPTCDDDPLTPSSLNDTSDPTQDLTTTLYVDYPPQNFSLDSSNSSSTSDNSTLLENPDLDYPFNDSLEDEDIETDVFGRPNDLGFVLDHNNDTSVDERSSSNATIPDDSAVFNYNRSNEIPTFVASSFSNETDDGVNVTVTATTTQAPKKKSDRCAEADMSVCRTWSKRKLLRAQTCCNNGVHTAALSESCRNYGKKRCKKIRTVLKCCLKTSYIEGRQPTLDDVTSKVNNASIDDVTAKVNVSIDDVKVVNASLDDHKGKVVNATLDDVRIEGHHTSADDVRVEGHHTSAKDVKVEGHHTSADDVTIEVTTAVTYVVCCKEEGGQRTCRVSLEGACEADETLGQDAPRLQTN